MLPLWLIRISSLGLAVQVEGSIHPKALPRPLAKRTTQKNSSRLPLTRFADEARGLGKALNATNPKAIEAETLAPGVFYSTNPPRVTTHNHLA